ncbi:MAG: outer membrane protein assembly factor BamE, partial [Candidatus Omnitrophota bacterium]
AGCADIEIPKTSQLIKNPLPNTVRVGMTKDQVVDIYGDPNIKDTVVSDKWAGTREEWIYKAEMSALPVSTNYLGEDLYLYFDGDNLTNVSKEPLGKEAKLKR